MRARVASLAGVASKRSYAVATAEKPRVAFTPTHPDPAASSVPAAPAHLPLYARPPLTFTHGEGSFLISDSGARYLDLAAGIAVNSLGHGDPDVLRAIAEQAAKVVHVSNLYHNEHAGVLAGMLVRSLQVGGRWKDGGKVFFGNSGAEANEAALKFAKKYARQTFGKQLPAECGTPTCSCIEFNAAGSPVAGGPGTAACPFTKYKMVSFTHAFHGRTMGALSATPAPKYQAPFAPLVPGFEVADYNDAAGAAARITEDVAGVIVEPVQGEGGVTVGRLEFLEAIRKQCDEVGAVLIYDEIQCGLGRTGKLHAHHNFPAHLAPDIMTLAKPLANGIPIGAAVLSEKIASVVTKGDHGTTFGGNPFACAVGRVCLEKISRESTLSNVAEMGALLKSSLEAVAKAHPKIVKEVRGAGLMVGMELQPAYKPESVVDMCREQGVLVIGAGLNTVRFLPSLVIKREEVEMGVRAVRAAVEALNA